MELKNASQNPRQLQENIVRMVELEDNHELLTEKLKELPDNINDVFWQVFLEGGISEGKAKTMDTRSSAANRVGRGDDLSSVKPQRNSSVHF